MAVSSVLPSFLQLTGAVVLFLLARVIYRLTFHPLAKFPGPKLAAMTRMYAASWDIPVATSYVKEFPKYHDKYGPIVRIEPNHLHIRDLDAFNQIYKPMTKFKRDPWFYSLPILDESFFNILESRDAKPHKDHYQPYFSRNAVMKLEVVIHENLTKFLARLSEAAETSKTVDLSLGYKCLVADGVMKYCYDKPFGALDSPDFEYPLILDLEPFFEDNTQGWYFPGVFRTVFKLFEALPPSLVAPLLTGPIKATLDIQEGCKTRIREMQKNPPSKDKPTVFTSALNPDREKGQKVISFKGLSGDALLFFIAGTDTTAHALVTGTWHLLQNPSKIQKLQAELKEAIPDPNGPISKGWSELEKLPYLRAVIKESLRLSYGVPGKLSRIVPAEGATFCGQRIPPGTAVSSSAYVYHTSPHYFPDASLFLPERWLDPATFAELDSRMLSFSRGSRSCIGINLATAQLYNTFAYVFRRFDLRVSGTTERDMEWHDAFTPATFGHLKVSVGAAED